MTDKEQIKVYLGNVFNESEKLNRRVKRAFIAMVVFWVIGSATVSLSKEDVLDIAKNSSGEVQNMVGDTLKQDSSAIDADSLIAVPKIEEKGNLLDSIAFKESTMNPDTVNTIGYIGKYQFHNAALVDAGVCKNMTEAETFRQKFITAFKSETLEPTDVWSEEDQDIAMLSYMKKNKHYLRNFKDYIGKTINGIEITWSGLLSAAHLGGHGRVKQFLKSDGKIDRTDGNKTPVSEYMDKFGGYSIDV